MKYSRTTKKKREKSSEKAIIINPELTIEKLEEITDNARNIIVSLYLTCEADFMKELRYLKRL